jgi:histidinol-phosphate phosphatase family protein
LKESLSDGAWALFLDRDGVINERIVDGYVRNPSEFRFIHGVQESMKMFSRVFKYIFIVTNQQGIGKGLMSETDLMHVHDHMLQNIKKHGGRIDGIYYSPHLDSENHSSRKPNPGMALEAKKDFPEIDFSRSVMVGDMEKDIAFGQKLGMLTIFIGSTKQFDIFEPDYRYDSLLSFAKTL